MKKTILYSAFILLLFFLLYLMNKNTPNEYRWRPTFSTRDKQPFGAYALDKMIDASWEEGYYHNYESILELITYSENETGIEAVLDVEAYIPSKDGTPPIADFSVINNFLIIANRLDMDDEDTDILLKYVEKGGSVLIATNNIYGKLQDTLNIWISNNYNIYLYGFLNLNKQEYAGSSIWFYAPDKADAVYSFPEPLVGNFFEMRDSTNYAYFDSIHIISETKDNKIISLRYQIGKGNLILSCNPLAYTNYGILSDSINAYLWNHLAYLKGRPLIRTEYYETGSQGDKSQSEFRALLDVKTLKWAFYTTLIAILIFMIFTAKRKQKPIPIIQPPTNKLLAFVRSIAGLYLQKNNNADILLKKQIYWGDEMKRKYGIDIINEPQDHEFYNRVVAKTGYSFEEVRRLFINLRAIDEDMVVSDEEMLGLIVKMNNMTK